MTQNQRCIGDLRVRTLLLPLSLLLLALKLPNFNRIMYLAIKLLELVL